jgi:DNA polymerase-3 subunit gamma/tau
LSIVLAIKYRPKSFDSLVGQDSIAKTLSLALDSNRLSHAYLFSGIRGSGKTSTARIFAKAMLCESGPTSKPCEICEQCIMANEGRHIDIIEMDAASNRGIDDIKELIEHTKYKPSVGRFKVFIIDEVHMLTTQAFNALLKTLEEPPEYVKFILATTDPLKLPATILSRVQHFRFKKISENRIKEYLASILKREKIDFEETALEIISRSADGSLRDSLTLLDQAIIYGGGRVTKDVVTDMLGIVDPEIIDELFKSILKGDRDAIIEFIKSYEEYESEMIIDEISIFLKDALFKNGLNALMVDRLFRVLADAKELLHIGSGGDFVLALTLFRLAEVATNKPIDRVVEDGDKANKRIFNREPFRVENQEREKKRSLESGEDRFQELIERLYSYDRELGEIFKNKIKFISFKDKQLIWESFADGDEKLFLSRYWQKIKLEINELFGIDIEIKPIKKVQDESKKMDKRETEEKEKLKNSQEAIKLTQEEELKRIEKSIRDIKKMLGVANIRVNNPLSLDIKENIVGIINRIKDES